jgi:hypothetical protein
MGRLEDIVARNRNPGKHGKNRFPLGVALAIFVFIILILMVFTDLDEDPVDEKEKASDQNHEHHVDGIYLGTPKRTVVRDAGSR